MQINDDAVFLLGAGASREAGVPISHELTPAIQERIVGQPRFAQHAFALNFVTAALMLYDAANDGASPFDGLDVERVFAAIQLLGRWRDLEVSPFVASWHPAVHGVDQPRPQVHTIARELRDGLVGDGRRGPSSSAADRAVRRLIRVGESSDGRIFRELETLMLDRLRELVSTTTKDVSYLGPLVQLASRSGGLSVVTLNYDLSIEQAAQHANIRCIAELPSAGAESRTLADEGLNLIKLHGSIDWLWREISEPGRLPRRVVERAQNDDAGAPALVFGQGAKLRAEGPFLQLFSSFERVLTGCSQLVCVGYSFRDEHVNELIRRWTGDNGASRLTVVDPGWPTQFHREQGSFRHQIDRALATPQAPAASRPAITLEIVRLNCGVAFAGMSQDVAGN